MSTISLSSQGQSDSIGFKNDLKILRRALEETHPNLYRFTSKERFQVVFDSIDKQITSKTNQLEFFRLISKIEFLIRESHTYLQPSKSLDAEVQQQKLFPFQVDLSDKTIIIKKSIADIYKLHEGQEIYSINGKNTDQIIAQISNSTGLKSGYNNSGLLNILSFQNNFAFAYYYFVDTANTFLIEFKGQKKIVEVPGLKIDSAETFPEYPNEPDPPINFQIDSNTSTAVLKITTFAHWTVSYNKKQYRKAFFDYFNKIEKATIKYLIIDLRDNRGGEEILAAELLSYLVDSEFEIYKHIKAKTLNFDYGLPETTTMYFPKRHFHKTDSGYFKIKDEVMRTFLPKSKYHFNGKVYVLSNGGSRSATNTLLSLMHTFQVATIIGQESGGVYEDVDGRIRIDLILPHSKIQLAFPALSFKINSSNGDRDRGVIPDHIIMRKNINLDNSKDPEMELAFKLINEHK